jgi:hypothetical protein
VPTIPESPATAGFFFTSLSTQLRGASGSLSHS